MSIKRIGHKNGLIIALNQKLNGWASYHRVCEAREAFRHIDSIVSILLLKYLMEKYPNKSQKQLINQYWWKASDGRYIFAIPGNSKVRVVSLEDTILIEPKWIDTSKNVYLQKEYFDTLDDNIEIRNVTGKYKEIWTRQEGKCAICGKKIESYQDRKVIPKSLYKKKIFLRDLIYIHSKCEESELVIIKSDNYDIGSRKVEDYIKEINKISNSHVKKKQSKFDNLKVYFHNNKKNKITLSFNRIEQIIGSKLCNSAYKHQSYFYNHSDERAIANSWTSQGYKITNCDLEKQTISFEKTTANKPYVKIPDYIFKDIPLQAKYEIENFFKEIKIKYNL